MNFTLRLPSVLLWCLIRPRMPLASAKEWHDWWAWYPVRAGTYSWTWLTWTKRKIESADELGGGRVLSCDGTVLRCSPGPMWLVIPPTFAVGWLVASFFGLGLLLVPIMLLVRAMGIGGDPVGDFLMAVTFVPPLILLLVVTPATAVMGLVGLWINRHLWWPRP